MAPLLITGLLSIIILMTWDEDFIAHEYCDLVWHLLVVLVVLTVLLSSGFVILIRPKLFATQYCLSIKL